MIEVDQVIPLLLDACPGFRPAWDQYYTRWYADAPAGAPPSYYSDIGVFNSYLFDSAKTHRTECFPAAFRIIEQLFEDGSKRVQDLAATGILEGLQNRALNAGIDHAIFLPWLGPKTRQEWFALIKGWGD